MMLLICFSYDDVKKEQDAIFHQSYSDRFQIKEETLEIREVKMEINEEKTEVNMFAETKEENLQIKKEINQENCNYTNGKLVLSRYI